MEREYRSKRLDARIEAALGEHARQVMLSRASEHEELLPFLSGRCPLHLVRPSRPMALVTLRAIPENPNEFVLYPGAETSLDVVYGETVLLLFQTLRFRASAQVRIQDVDEQQAIVEALDPRLDKRYFVRATAKIRIIGEQLVSLFRRKQMSLMRMVDFGGAPRRAFPVSCNDQVVDAGGREVQSALLMDTSPAQSGLVTDVSAGGCCVRMPHNALLMGAREESLVLVDFDIPAIRQSVSLRVFAIVRRMRADSDHVVLHCMFVERIPQRMLAF